MPHGLGSPDAAELSRSLRWSAWGVFWALGWLALVPENLFAWGPATHLAIGETLLASLHLLPPALRILLERFPAQFLYGSMAADISFAKKYAQEGRHCHKWEIGREIHAAADEDALQAVGIGYLAHLAADTIAHNVFVPRQLLLTSSSRALGHTYWEHRMDMHVGEEFLGKAKALVTGFDHSAADEMFDRVLSSTLFSFQTNRRIFRGMIRFQGNERWQRVFDQVLKNSRFDLPEPLVDRYFQIAFDYVVDYLVRGEASRPAQLDPVGELNLRLAKRLRHRSLADGGIEDPAVVHEAADDFFPIPDEPLLYWPHARFLRAGNNGGVTGVGSKESDDP